METENFPHWAWKAWKLRVCPGCHHEGPQMERLKQQRSSSSQFWRLKVPQAWLPLRTLSLTCARPPSDCVFSESPLCAHGPSVSQGSPNFLFLKLIRFRLDLEKEMATHSSTLAWKIPWTEEPGRLQPMRS